MSDGKIHLDLVPGVDRDGKKYYVAKLKGPFLLDCSEKAGGVAFMVFVSEEGNEELQIAQITAPTKRFEKERDGR